MALSYRPSRTALLNPCADPTFKIIFIELPKIKHLPDDVSKLTKPQMWG